MRTERRTATAELRVEGRRVSGVALPYSEVSRSHRERFEPGSVRFADAVHLDIQHDRERAVAWSPGGGLELAADEAGVQVSADLPPIPAADRILEEIRSGKRNGLSVEFHSLKETREAGVRVIQEAVLTGVAIVAAPSYKSARIEARAKRRRIWL